MTDNVMIIFWRSCPYLLLTHRQFSISNISRKSPRIYPGTFCASPLHTGGIICPRKEHPGIFEDGV